MTKFISNLFPSLSKRATTILIGAAATAVLGLAPTFAAANPRYDDGRDHRNFERHDDNHPDYDRRDSRTDLHVDINLGRDHSEPVYEDRVSRVWVEPSYRTVVDRHWVEPQYRTVCDRVWREAVVEDRCVDVNVPGHWEWHEVIHDDGRECRTVREHVWVHGRTVVEHRQVVVSAGHWEDVQRQEQVCAGHWENCERQELVCAGHWEEHVDRVAVERRHDRGLDIIADVVTHLGR